MSSFDGSDDLFLTQIRQASDGERLVGYNFIDGSSAAVYCGIYHATPVKGEGMSIKWVDQGWCRIQFCLGGLTVKGGHLEDRESRVAIIMGYITE